MRAITMDHIARVFRHQPVGTFMTVDEIAEYSPPDWPDYDPYEGPGVDAISGWLFPTPEQQRCIMYVDIRGIESEEGPPRGARKVSD